MNNVGGSDSFQYFKIILSEKITYDNLFFFICKKLKC